MLDIFKTENATEATKIAFCLVKLLKAPSWLKSKFIFSLTLRKVIINSNLIFKVVFKCIFGILKLSFRHIQD